MKSGIYRLDVVFNFECVEDNTEGILIGDKGLVGLKIHPVDAVEVVRCKDCKHRTLDFFGGHCCKLHKGLAMVTDESFCSYGERKEHG